MCVPLDLEHQQSPYFDNFQQVEQAYINAITTNKFYGPSVLKTCFNQAMAISNERGNKDFIVAIIITDGNTDDIKGDCEALVEASKQPICFVGVGVTKSINYDTMNKFDDLKLRKFDNF